MPSATSWGRRCAIGYLLGRRCAIDHIEGGEAGLPVNAGGRRIRGLGLDAVFSPRRVALVGASERVGSVGRLLWDNLRLSRRGGAGVPGRRSVRPHRVCRPARCTRRRHLAVIATPAATVPEVVRAAAGKAVGAVVVLSAGFAETGPDGARLQAEAVAAARAGHVRLVGPNCFGVQNADLPLNASIAAGTPRAAGESALSPSPGPTGWPCTPWRRKRRCASPRSTPPPQQGGRSPMRRCSVTCARTQRPR